VTGISIKGLLGLFFLCIGAISALVLAWQKLVGNNWERSLRSKGSMAPLGGNSSVGVPVTELPRPPKEEKSEFQPVLMGRVRICPTLKVVGTVETRQGYVDQVELMWTARIKGLPVPGAAYFEVRQGEAAGSEMDLGRGLKAACKDGDSMDLLVEPVALAIHQLHRTARIRTLILMGGSLHVTAKIRGCNVQVARKVSVSLDQVAQAIEKVASQNTLATDTSSA
jgi:hypothetical protein